MNDVVDRILTTYQLVRPLDAERAADSRRKITRYIESLTSAGHATLGQRETLLGLWPANGEGTTKALHLLVQQLLLIFYSASERGDHQGNTMIPTLPK
jgi:hypothetical protein